MKNRFCILITFLFAFSTIAISHPLGNFSVNQFTRIEVEKSQIGIRQVLDLAEIPTFQESQKIDTDDNGSLSEAELNRYLDATTLNYIANLELFVDGQLIVLQPTSKRIFTADGSGGLKTLRVEWDLLGDLALENLKTVHRIKFENKNHTGRTGWNEIVIGRVSGISIFDSNAFGNGISKELTAYPEDTLNAPLSERSAEFSFTSGEIPAAASVLQNRDGNITVAIQKDRFAELIAVPEITPTIIIFGLLLAFGLGAVHAMSPGHGKAVVGAYLVGVNGTPKHAVLLGLTVTVTHTLGVFAIGLLTLFASNYILPERLMPFLNFFSGLLVLFIGLTLFKQRLLTALGYKIDSHAHHDHVHDGLPHSHGGSTHTHLPPEKVTWKNLLALGISGGLLPCPSALVLMLAAISMDRIGYGLVLTVAFSFGLAATLTCVGLIFLYLGKLFMNKSLGNHPIIKALPVFSSFVIACLGAVICYQAL